MREENQKMRKTDMEELTSFEIDTTFTHITTLEDLKKFPDLSTLEILFTVDLQSEEERQDFKNLASKSACKSANFMFSSLFL